MTEWLNQHLDTLITLILAVASGFFTFVFAIAIIILKHRERIKGNETRLEGIDRRLQKLEQEVKPSPKEFKTAVEQLKDIIDNLKSAASKPDSNGVDSQKRPKFVPKIPIQGIKGAHKSKKRLTRTNKIAKESK